MVMLFVNPRGDAQVYVPESCDCTSLIESRYLEAFSSGTALHPIKFHLNIEMEKFE
jgi:hypothetical protein